MSVFKFEVADGTSKLLKTAGKYCDRDIYVVGAASDYVAPTQEKDVNFYDYDGTLLYSYTLEEAQALTELPPLPSHDGLVCQGWNWTLDSVKALTRRMNVGATYITDDGKTRLYINLKTNVRLDVPLYITQTVSNGVEIDWGDGSSIETLSGTNLVNTTHRYAKIGEYVITLNPSNSCGLIFGDESAAYAVFGKVAAGSNMQNSALQKVEIGKNVTLINRTAFRTCRYLETITIPNTVARIMDYAFYDCNSLAAIMIPSSCASLYASVFQNAVSLRVASLPEVIEARGSLCINNYSLRSAFFSNRVTRSSSGGTYFDACNNLEHFDIPDTWTEVPGYMFRNCYALGECIVPAEVTTIAANAFAYCYNMAVYDFTKATAVPVLENTSAFTGIPTDCQIRVPAALYDEWIAATNWATYASNIVGV